MMLKKAVVNSILIVCLTALFFPTAVLALDLREVGNTIPFSQDAAASGLFSGTMIIQDGDSAWFVDELFKTRRLIKLEKDQKMIMADNGQYYAVVSSLDDEYAQSQNLCRVVVYDHRGRQIWTFEDISGGDIYLSPMGDYFLSARGSKGAYN